MELMLWWNFYTLVPLHVYRGEQMYALRLKLPDGRLILPECATAKEMQARRDALLPKDFRFAYPLLPKGAHYV